MKTEEDEAFDELARKQGMWGGGFKAKQAMAADKQHWNEDEWRRNNWRCGHGWLRGEQCEICNAPQPAQEPVAWMSEENDCIFFDADKPNSMDYDFWTPLYTAPPQRERVLFPTMLRKMWSGGEVQAWLDENVNKEKNNGT
jgi:hypothetical protein